MQTFHEELDDAAIVGVAFGASEAEVSELINGQGLTFPNVYDPHGSVPATYEVGGVPNYIILDKSGRIAYEIRGAPRDLNSIKERLVELGRE